MLTTFLASLTRILFLRPGLVGPMRLLLCCWLSGLALGAARAQSGAPSWLLVAQSRVTSVYGASATRCAVDGSGNTFVVGTFNDVVSFGTLPPLTSRGASDVFVAKLSPAGQWLWAQAAGGSGSDYGTSIGLTAGGDVVVAGSYAGTARFGTLPAVPSSGGQDAFVARLSGATGQWLSTQHAGGGAEDYCSSLVVTPTGEVLVCGTFNRMASFGPALRLTSAGAEDAFVARLTANLATWQWVAQAGSDGMESASDLALTSTGDAVVLGNFANSSTGDLFDNLPPLLSSGGRNMFVAHLQGATGHWQWAVGAAGFGGTALAALPATDELVVAGNFAGNVNLTGIPLTSAGSNDIFAARLSGSTAQWLGATRAGGPGDDTVNDLVPVAPDAVVVVGYLNATATFGSLPALATAGTRDLYAARLTLPTNRWDWALRAGGPNYDSGNGVAVAPNGRLVLAGYFGQQVSFGGLPALSSTSLDAFVAQLGPAVTAAGTAASPVTTALAYPNPASGRVAVQLPGHGAAHAELLNALGQVVRQASWPAGTAGPALEVRGLPAGPYQLLLTQDGRRYAQRLIIE